MLLCDTDLPHAGFFAVHNSHIVNLVPLNVQSLRLIQVLCHKTHKRVVWGVGCQGQTKWLAIQCYKSNFMSTKEKKKWLNWKSCCGDPECCTCREYRTNGALWEFCLAEIHCFLNDTIFYLWVRNTRNGALTGVEPVSSRNNTVYLHSLYLVGWLSLQISNEVKQHNKSNAFCSVIFAVVVTCAQSLDFSSNMPQLTAFRAQNNTMNGSAQNENSQQPTGRCQVGSREKQYFQSIFKPEIKADIFQCQSCDNSKYFRNSSLSRN